MVVSLRPDEREVRFIGEPVPVTVVDGFGVWYPSIQSVFELTAWREDRGDVSALVTVWRRDGDDDRRLVHRSRLLMYGPRSRTDFVNLLKQRTSRWPFVTDWLFCLETIVSLAMSWYEVGEPLVDLFAIDPPATIPYLFEPLVPDGEFCLLFGMGGTLKSYLGLLLCLSTATGAAIPGLGKPGRTGRVLYLDYETSAGTHARRVRSLAAGLGIGHPAGMVLYRQMSRPLHQEAHQIRRLVAERDIALVVIDSVGMACGGDINAAADTLKTIIAINSLGPCAKLGVGHKNKGDDYMGSAYWRNGPRAMWEVNGEQASGGTQRLGYIHRKANDDRIRDPFGLSASFEPDGRIFFEPLDARTLDVVNDRLPDLERVARFIEEAGEATASEIADSLGIAARTVRAYLSRLERAGRIERGLDARPGPGQQQQYRAHGNKDGDGELPF